MNKTKRFLVHLHLYYQDQVEYFISKLNNIQLEEWDLYVTGNGLAADVRERISAFKSDAVFIDIPNVGYDLWPFIRVLKEADLSRYDVIIKLHTKGAAKHSCIVAGFRVRGFGWRDEMVDCLLGDIDRFRSLSRSFDDPRTGLVCSFPFYKKLTGYLWEDVRAESEMARYGLTTGNSRFVAGSIFAVRASSMQFLRDARLRQEDFESGNSSHFSGTPAHIYERVISLAPTAQGLEAVTVELSARVSFFVRLRRALQPLVENLFSLRREGSDRKKYLRILFLRVKVSD